MSESLGLSIGVANLVAARVGSAPVTRRSVLTFFDHRAAEVGLPEENPGLAEPGLVLRGFVERVGDRAPLVAADGTRYLGEALTVEALDAMELLLERVLHSRESPRRIIHPMELRVRASHQRSPGS